MTWQQRLTAILVMILGFVLSARSSEVLAFDEKDDVYKSWKDTAELCSLLAAEVKNFDGPSESFPLNNENLTKWFMHRSDSDEQFLFQFFKNKFEDLLLSRMNLSMEQKIESPLSMGMKDRKVLAMGVLQLIRGQQTGTNGALLVPDGYGFVNIVKPIPRVLSEDVIKTVDGMEVVEVQYKTVYDMETRRVFQRQVAWVPGKADSFEIAMSHLSFVSLRSVPAGAKVTFKEEGGKAEEELEPTNSEIWLARGNYEFVFLKDGVERIIDVEVDKDIEKIYVNF
jgi:hypothetical protein